MFLVKALAIDLGGTHATCGLLDDSTILAHKIIDTDAAENLRDVLPRFANAFCELLNALSLKFSDFAGVALGFAGLVDSRIGRIVGTNKKYVDAPDVDLSAWSRQTFGIPLRVENDARIALLGEKYAGAAQGTSDVVMMTLGTGIGGAAMIEGKLLRGKHAQAGCLGGHLPVLFNGRRCTCGAIGCAEAEAAGWSLPLIVKDWPGASASTLAQHAKIGFKELFEEAARDDAVALAIRERCLHIWATDALALVHAYDPELIVIGGGAMESAEVIVTYVESHVQRYAWTPWGKVRVRAAELGNNAALLGAIPLLSEASR